MERRGFSRVLEFEVSSSGFRVTFFFFWGGGGVVGLRIGETQT